MPRMHLVAALLASLTLAACGGDSTASGAAGSGASCPPGGTTLRYTGGGNGGTEPADFGSTFFASYCVACHGAVPSGGAPSHATFNVLAVIKDHAALIDQKAARGPARTNTAMPPAGALARPGDAERTNLGLWIACGTPAGP
jgi:cytochrome c5